jgi:hypothetical protein
VGIVSLILGLVGLVIARRREVWYFAGLAMVSLWLAFASYAPFDLYRILWSVPGFSSFRVPGRYNFLFVVAWSVLAAFGLQAVFPAAQGSGRWRGGAWCCCAPWRSARWLDWLTWGDAGPCCPTAVPRRAQRQLSRAAALSRGLEVSDVYRGLVFSLSLGNSGTRLSC